MNDDSSEMSQIGLLKQKLQATKVALEEINDDRNSKLIALTQFITQMSLACKGQNLELDNKLAKLRVNMGNFEHLDEVLPELPEIERLLKSQYHHVMGKLEQGRSGLTNFSRELLRIKHIPEKLSREISIFRQELSKPFHSLWDYIPKVEQLISYYEQALLQNVQDEPLIILPIHRQLSYELAQLISDIEFPKAQREQVLRLKDILASDSLQVETLLEAYQTILRLLLENIAREKATSQEFLQTLNDALTSVRDIVSESFSQTQHSQQLKQQLNGEINNQVNNVLNSLNEIDEISQLKQKVTEHLAEIQNRLARKEALEQREMALLQKSVNTLRKELADLSAETLSYRERLCEQQKINQLDSLTQLPNRAALDERMDQEFRRFQHNNSTLWVAVADIDHFKQINDSFGHSTGDKTLQVIAMALKNSLRDTEFVARYGGEEFVLLIPDVSANDIAQLLNRVREKIKNIPFKFKNQRITVTLSIGAAQVLNGEHILDTFERADAALYKAKHESRDRVIID
ncbi:diguanylate cyclase [Shewanella yunxiaonensis]|uniref:diguanylate cyclase n=1 Tax=Shewanella yunxiaonensis TaxID=2829809 RepID=A0ABX7YR27_9GAMM|nr:MULTISPECIES: GGDEF domain-containing protein [Shewanella]MDF0534527.1 diguanylate cyclase [Shewanella sp. A32]QUN04850.1 diguanylate cyclase [Shewanella yunxiaonensis]